ncbi:MULTISPECIES: ABC transporter permease [Streptomycetaceae]|uniref:Putative ABC transporter permease protein n=1 Tax=Streptantibioticus cattleyicolor (strain ATCC 35852 / DSM 46488 / JCM 4925 / NBRC 14057 / NRRL 8057) TaxID=1003195 RepID=F8JW91_STREN|nr:MULTISPECIES: ABC transporter permease [Streptomycetaceae]AEW94460.1 putative ABC transporter permease protein [Streptantibioticus cattleyicolor NRRL 8057 = DSM 46488]MYS59105.1 FtsX-like permease family protein [Streptomyces sp. SID5468]CCB74816.1 putative ABC transporter permease protein [Streptantibioticus cattleyicolor NRRL 8057 = DSM 46488]
MLRTAVRNVLAHKARLLMTVLAVLLGVAFVSGTLVFTDTLGTAYKKQASKSYDDVAVAITSHGADGPPGKDGKPSDPGLSARTLDRIAHLPGVASATGRVNGFAGVADAKGKLIGNGWSNTGANFAPGKDGKDPRYHFTTGAPPARTGEVALDSATAAKGGYHVGDPARVATNGPVKTYTVTGIFTTDDGAVSAGGSLVLFDTASAQRLYLSPGYFQDITVTAAPGTSEQRVLAEVTPLLPKDSAEAHTGKQLADDQAKSIEREFSSLSTMLLAFAGIALFVGIFLIANTFSMLVAQRTKELALLRALGAGRGQVERSVLAEALIVGVVASAAGFAAGVGIAVALRSAMGSFGAKVPAGPLMVAPSTVLTAFLVGVLVTVVAALIPAVRASRVPPVAAMSNAELPAKRKSLVVRNVIGALVAAIGVGLIALGAATGGSSGRWSIAGGGFFLLIGVIMLTPLLSQPVLSAVRPLLAKVFGVSGNLAARNARRNPRRTAATASALAIGLTLITGLSVLGVSLGRSIDKSTVDSLSADYMVKMANGMPLDASVADEVAKVPGVTATTALEAAYFDVDGKFSAISAADPGTLTKTVRIGMVTGSASALADGKILVEERTAHNRGWKVGDAVQARFPDGRHGELTVGGTFHDNLVLSPIVLPAGMLAPHVDKAEIPQVLVRTAGGASDRTAQAITDGLGDNPSITVIDRQGIRDSYGGMINSMLEIMYGLLGMSLVIAVLGVVNTLAMSVFERRRELGMLRAIGLDRRQVKSMIRQEAVVISLFGAVTGVVLGLFLAWAIGSTLAGDVPGYVMVLPWTRMLVFLALAALVGVLAAVWPARRAARLDILQAIKTE